MSSFGSTLKDVLLPDHKTAFGSAGEISSMNFDTLTPEQKKLLGLEDSTAYFGGSDRYGDPDNPLASNTVEGSNYLDDMNRGIMHKYTSEADDVYKAGAAYDSGLQGYSDYMKSRPGTKGLRDFEHGYGAVDNLIRKGTDFDEEYFKTNVQNPLMRTMQEEIMPGIAREYGSGGGFYSSDRMLQDKNMQDKAIESMTDSRAKMVYENKQQNIANMLEAVGLGQGMRISEGEYGLNRANMDSTVANRDATTGMGLDKYKIGVDEANMMTRYGMENKYSADLKSYIERMMSLGTGKMFDTAVGTEGAQQGLLFPMAEAGGAIAAAKIAAA